MKVIRYDVLGHLGVYNEDTQIVENVECITNVTKPYSEANEETAKQEAHNGEYTIEDDGIEETHEPTDAERIAELEEALAMLLNGVTE